MSYRQFREIDSIARPSVETDSAHCVESLLFENKDILPKLIELLQSTTSAPKQQQLETRDFLDPSFSQVPTDVKLVHSAASRGAKFSAEKHRGRSPEEPAIRPHPEAAIRLQRDYTPLRPRG